MAPKVCQPYDLHHAVSLTLRCRTKGAGKLTWIHSKKAELNLEKE